MLKSVPFHGTMDAGNQEIKTKINAPFFLPFAIVPKISQGNEQNAACCSQCDQKKITKCLQKLPKNDFTRKMIILTPLQKLPENMGRFGQINCCQRLLKVAQSPINLPIWSHW